MFYLCRNYQRCNVREECISVLWKIYHGKQGCLLPVESLIRGISDPVQGKCVLSPGEEFFRKRIEIKVLPLCKGNGRYVDTAAEGVTGYVFNGIREHDTFQRRAIFKGLAPDESETDAPGNAFKINTVLECTFTYTCYFVRKDDGLQFLAIGKGKGGDRLYEFRNNKVFPRMSRRIIQQF